MADLDMGSSLIQKYQLSGNSLSFQDLIRRGHGHPLEEENSGGSSSPYRKRKGRTQLQQTKEAAGEIIRKPRGRPRGSRNKQKPPINITRDGAPTAMRCHVLEIAGGCDVGEKLTVFARTTQRGLCVLGASGMVANVTLRQAQQQQGGPVITFHGHLQILSLSGSFFPPDPATPTLPPGMTVALMCSRGSQVVGGQVVGQLMAATPVLVTAISFLGASYDRLPLLDRDDPDVEDQDTAGQSTSSAPGPTAAGPSSSAPPSIRRDDHPGGVLSDLSYMSMQIRMNPNYSAQYHQSISASHNHPHAVTNLQAAWTAAATGIYHPPFV